MAEYRPFDDPNVQFDLDSAYPIMLFYIPVSEIGF